MKKNIIIANWKMNLCLKETVVLTKDILSGLKKMSTEKVEIVFSPSFIALPAVKELTANSPVRLAAQDCFWEERGAYTGEISPWHLKEIGCQYVLIGH